MGWDIRESAVGSVEGRGWLVMLTTGGGDCDASTRLLLGSKRTAY